MQYGMHFLWYAFRIWYGLFYPIGIPRVAVVQRNQRNSKFNSIKDIYFLKHLQAFLEAFFMFYAWVLSPSEV